MVNSRILSDYHILKESLRGSQQFKGDCTLSDHNLQKELFLPLTATKAISDIAGKQLENSRTLPNYNVQKEHTLFLLVGPRVEIHISLMTMAGKTMTSAVETSDMIDNAKATAHDKEGISIFHPCLIFLDKQFEDDRTLSAFEIQKEIPLQQFYPKESSSMIPIEMKETADGYQGYKEIPWCTVILVVTPSRAIISSQGKLCTSTAMQHMGASSGDWSRAGLDLARTLRDKLDILMTNANALLTDAIPLR